MNTRWGAIVPGKTGKPRLEGSLQERADAKSEALGRRFYRGEAGKHGEEATSSKPKAGLGKHKLK